MYGFTLQTDEMPFISEIEICGQYPKYEFDLQSSFAMYRYMEIYRFGEPLT